MNLPILPLDYPSLHLEGHTFRLSNIDRLEIFTVPAFSFNRCRMIVVDRRLVNGSADGGNVDVDDLLGVGVEDRRKVEWEGILAVVDMRPIIHQSLL